jgi:hypothetical protein
LAGGDDGALDGVRWGEVAAQHGGNLRHPDGFHGWQRGIEPEGEQRLDFGDGAIFQHRTVTAGDPVAEDIAIGIEHELLDLPAREQRRLRRVLEAGEGTAGGGKHGKGAGNALRIGLIEACGNQRIAGGDEAGAAIAIKGEDFGLDGGTSSENPVVLRFLRESDGWKFDWLQFVNLGKDDATRQSLRSGGRDWLNAPQFSLSGTYPPIPKPCREPYQVAGISVIANGCRVSISINAGMHVESIENDSGGRVITGGLQKGPNPLGDFA